ncbi:hypothetical protein MAQ5080_02188 [Marinomonas aquimarina]|uniref:Methylamine utilization protein n=1 Tax=Marinomonas aquimarina TaxID=295068 RepID=A0A1A8TGD9_9GAMM|nr:methylamine utilization protein [Marinomonas aquimarina]SBS32211.1 hypothetical protein MAQ5080_02188 [Marinomonas aquimarina]
MLKYVKQVALVMCSALPALAWADVAIQVTDANGKPLADAVVFLKSPSLLSRSQPLTEAEIAQQNRTFIPGVQVVTQGTAVDFPNRDDVRHHVYSFSPAKTFELKLYIGKPEAPIVFDQVGIVELGCNIHDSMLGWVLVNDTPLYGVTDDAGVVRFDYDQSDALSVDIWHRHFPYGAPYETFELTRGKDSSEFTVALQTPGVAL